MTNERKIDAIYELYFEFDDERVLDAQTTEAGAMLYEIGYELGFRECTLDHRHEPDRTVPIISFGSVRDPDDFSRELTIERGVINITDWLGRVGLSDVSFSRAEISIWEFDADTPVTEDITIEAHALEAGISRLTGTDYPFR